MKRILHNVNDSAVFLIVSIIIPLFVLLPLSIIVFNFFEPHSGYYQALINSNAIFKSVLGTLEMITKVGVLTSIIGFSLAYIITFYDIKYRKLINILLIVPLAIPVYVAAYTYSNIFHKLPLLEELLTTEFMMRGSIFIYAFFLYPYVYIATKSYLNKNLSVYIEASQTLGESKFKTFFKVILPLSRPVIVGSALFAIFETLSDFAVVEYYGVQTLSRYISLAWYANGDFVSASKFSVYILFIMFVVIFTERLSRTNKKYSSAEVLHKPLKRVTPKKIESVVIYSFIGAVLFLSAVLPIYQMIVSAINNRSFIPRLDILEVTFNSIIITVLSIVVIVVAALVLTTATIHMKGYKKHILSSVSTMGYVIPSMVLALGIYIVFIRFDQWIYRMFRDVGLDRMLITSSILILIIGFFVKFFSIAYTNLLSAYNKVDKNVLEASETLGETKLSTLVYITAPMLRKSIIAVSIILFIDMFKELTIVYSLRPLNFKTLSTEVYKYAGNEMINVAAFPSLIIIGICVLLIVYLEGGFKK